MAVAVKERPQEKVWTYEDYLRLEDDKRYEVINGRLKEMPAPTTWHQDISRNLEFLMWNFVREKKLGKVYDAPIDVVLGDRYAISFSSLRKGLG